MIMLMVMMMMRMVFKEGAEQSLGLRSVSYTHLTLPTICSV